ncbi:hypothetical protein HID58_074164 [Brassica napus]|uniref:Uncharacterized protein n=1 Tax=Brassica napus TaxID=3708 RepID=A0ABQ7YG53_BRANA|nr:hypothetical protein HID58_074164 [Brassica napus]
MNLYSEDPFSITVRLLIPMVKAGFRARINSWIIPGVNAFPNAIPGVPVSVLPTAPILGGLRLRALRDKEKTVRVSSRGRQTEPLLRLEACWWRGMGRTNQWLRGIPDLFESGGKKSACRSRTEFPYCRR